MRPSEIERIKDLLPTSLGSAEIREQIAADILRRSVFSARMESAHYLAKVRDVCAALLDGTINQADARNTLEAVLEQLGHSMSDDGGLKNPISIRRLNLVVETQTQMAASVAQLCEQTEGVLAQWPAWELRRTESRAVPRPDWAARWRAAGTACGWEGALQDRFIALKTSPIWAALGNGAGGFKDTLGNPYPPFAFSSGMGWVDVSAAECERMGLDVNAGRSGIAPYRDDGGPSHRNDGRGRSPSAPSLAPGEKAIADAIKRFGIPNIAEGLV